MASKFKGKIQAAVRQVSAAASEAALALPRGPLLGQSPPHKRRQKDTEENDADDSETAKLTRVLKKELGDMITEKFEERDRHIKVLEEKIDCVAQVTDEAIGGLEEKIDDLQGNLGEVQTDIKGLKESQNSSAEISFAVDQAMDKKVKELELLFAKTAVVKDPKDDCTAVV